MSKPIIFNNFNLTGVSDNKYQGDGFYNIVGLDIHSDPATLIVSQKLVTESATPNEPCIIKTFSNGHTYYFSTSSGKIWMRDSSTGVVTLIYTTVASGGTHGCCGAYEYKSNIYWATNQRLHYIATSSAAVAWVPGAGLNWKNLNTTSYHHMAEVNDVLYIGDAGYVSQVDTGVFTANAIDIPTKYLVRCLCKYGTDLVIAAYDANFIS